MVNDGLRVEVVYATPEEQTLRPIVLPHGATVADALSAVAAEPPFNELALADCTFGVFGQVCAGTRGLCDGDRVEIYRALSVDAKSARLKRAAEQSTRSKR